MGREKGGSKHTQSGLETERLRVAVWELEVREMRKEMCPEISVQGNQVTVMLIIPVLQNPGAS